MSSDRKCSLSWMDEAIPISFRKKANRVPAFQSGVHTRRQEVRNKVMMMKSVLCGTGLANFQSFSTLQRRQHVVS
ncbi:hypothetical protein NQZ68_035880 [Dissostichus eleginoides]|nr:hypothetical protein NQZ68_035880 [Dissostichus eleginoides]